MGKDPAFQKGVQIHHQSQSVHSFTERSRMGLQGVAQKDYPKKRPYPLQIIERNGAWRETVGPVA